MNTLLPEQIKAKLRGQQFETFGDFKSALWSTYANDATCSKQFGAYQLNRMKKGWPPRAPFHQTLEGSRSYELCNHGPETQCHDHDARCCGRAAPVEQLPPKRLVDYTAAEFLTLIQTITSAAGTSAYQDALLEHFIEVVDHPDGSDLIYPHDPDDEQTPEQVLATLVAWRTFNQLPLFSDLQ
ncbi:bacteriocin immunity protein [Pseudomonas sp. S36]|uniref:bacteriocin immunity protein n=1 Tax=Pseudomonas sp. S36 TaxID=2767447 RepID=UPI001F4652DD|nr:bacteriocin immunity protein [Pseudomonas sp. S36]MBK4990324.1 S-type pyocin [Pseudomonas sp. S36]